MYIEVTKSHRGYYLTSGDIQFSRQFHSRLVLLIKTHSNQSKIIEKNINYSETNLCAKLSIRTEYHYDNLEEIFTSLMYEMTLSNGYELKHVTDVGYSHPTITSIEVHSRQTYYFLKNR